MLKNLTLSDEGVTPGVIRRYSVGVMDYRGAPAEDCEYLLDQLCEWLNGMSFPENLATVGAILKAIVEHLYLAWTHPFGDGNGRTARLVEVQILLCSGVPAPAAQLLSNHYNQTHTEYYRQLQQSSRSGGDITAFLRYAVQGFRDGLVEQIEAIRVQHVEVAWINYVHDKFHSMDGALDRRRRRLILELSAVDREWVGMDELTTISGKVAAEYATVGPKTLQRDVEKLYEMGLIEREGRRVRPNKAAILAFLPARARAPIAEERAIA